jgi:hypothetical protein
MDDDLSPPGLLPCPFCGGGETRLSEAHLPPRMEGPGALISVTLRHWCENVAPGTVSATREVRGRDLASATAEWNRRS